MAFQPTGSFVAIDPEPEPARTYGVLFLPPVKDWLPNRGTVTGCGRGQIYPNGRVEPIDLQVGDFVLFPPMVSDRQGEGYDTEGDRPVQKPTIVLHASRPFGVLKRKEDGWNFRPLYDRVLVKRLPPAEDGLVAIPDSARPPALSGEVIAVGEGKRTRHGIPLPIQVSLGDRVLFGKYAGDEVDIDGEDYVVLREGELAGIYES